jgi:hypothetical protein
MEILKKERAGGSEQVSAREGLFCFDVFESGICGQLGFFPPPPLFTQSVRRHTQACLNWVFAPETGQVFQHCALALPPRRHQEAQLVTRPHGASLLSAYPPFTSSPSLPLIPSNLGQTGGRQVIHFVNFTFKMRMF